MTLNKTVERLPGRCAHCGGTFIIDDGENKCVMCSRGVKGTIEKASYYEYNKDELMADIKQLGRKNVLLKWGIPGGSYGKLIRRWSNNGAPEPAPAI